MKKWKKWTRDEEVYLKNNYIKKTHYQLALNLNRSYKSVKRKCEEMRLKCDVSQKNKNKVKEVVPHNFTKDNQNYFLAGFVAGEGCFYETNNSFRFAIELADDDEIYLKKIKEILMCGRIHKYKKRKEHWKGTVLFAVTSSIEITKYLIPFMDVFLIESRKRKQYKVWKERFKKHYGLVV